MTAEALEIDPYPILAQLQRQEPVSWIPALNGWLITGRDEAIEAMRDAERFTVDDPRFTTAKVIGDSMLNMDGPEHTRHRAAFAEFFRPKAVRDGFEEWLDLEARRLLEPFLNGDEIELRTALAGPFAVTTIVHFLGLKDVAAADVLGWYSHITKAIVGMATGQAVSVEGRAAVDAIRQRVAATLADAGHPSLVQTIHDRGVLRPDEVTPATAVVMFGAIETSEGMTTNVLWHLLTNPEALAAVRADRSLVYAAVQESLRMEPAAAVVDRYTTQDVTLGDTLIPKGDLVTLSLLGANRDPEVFPDPDRFDIFRANHQQHVTFVEGPHRCVGLHLARAETQAAVNAVLDLFPDLQLVEKRSTEPAGLIFRKPAQVTCTF